MRKEEGQEGWGSGVWKGGETKRKKGNGNDEEEGERGIGSQQRRMEGGKREEKLASTPFSLPGSVPYLLCLHPLLLDMHFCVQADPCPRLCTLLTQAQGLYHDPYNLVVFVTVGCPTIH